ncbi:fruit-specific protein [Nicotiana attenuata]|uniref:Fruit-specific protein n=1 Tax=Nicotiana attenuata TaxID=49451 RepID=A0A1J6KFX6_NICAT|nr:fruit-specific protein [Nicotiana attenuata]
MILASKELPYSSTLHLQANSIIAMAIKSSLLKFAIFFSILLTATAVELTRTSEMKAMAIGTGLPLSISTIKMTLIPNDFFKWTCDRECRSDADCSDGVLCRTCWWHYQPYTDDYHYHCSIFPN